MKLLNYIIIFAIKYKTAETENFHDKSEKYIEQNEITRESVFGAFT